MKPHIVEMKSIADKLVLKLNEIGIESYIWHFATTGSVYIRFKDPKMCSIRIGDHNGRGKLKYKYNLRRDSVKFGWVKDDDVWRYFLPLNRWQDLIPILQERSIQVKDWNDSKYNYKIPSFKK